MRSVSLRLRNWRKSRLDEEERLRSIEDDEIVVEGKDEVWERKCCGDIEEIDEWGWLVGESCERLERVDVEEEE